MTDFKEFIQTSYVKFDGEYCSDNCYYYGVPYIYDCALFVDEVDPDHKKDPDKLICKRCAGCLEYFK